MVYTLADARRYSASKSQMILNIGEQAYFTPFCEALWSTVVTFMTCCDIHAHKSGGCHASLYFGAYYNTEWKLKNKTKTREAWELSLLLQWSRCMIVHDVKLYATL